MPKPMYTALAEAAVNLHMQCRPLRGLFEVRCCHRPQCRRRLTKAVRGAHHCGLRGAGSGASAHMIMVAEVAAATSGSTPISSISGPFTMPPPTPNMPV